MDLQDLVHGWGEHGSEGGHEAGGACGYSSAALEPVRFEPADAAEGVEPDAPLRILFSGPIDPTSVALEELALTRSGSVPSVGSIAVDGCAITFTPSERLTLGSAFALRLEGSVRGAGGVEWTGSVQSVFRTRDGVWSEPENVTAVGDTPELAIAPDGTALAAWQVPATVSDAGQTSAFVALAERGPSAVAWQEVPVSGTSGGPFAAPHRLVAADDGSFVFLWRGLDLEGSVYHPGQGLGEIVRPAARGTSADGDGVSAGGDTWLAAAVNGFVILFHTTDGESWTGLRGVFLDQFSKAAPAVAGPRLLADAAGNASVFWAQSTGVYASSFASGGEPGAWAEPRAIVEGDPAITGAFLAAGSALGNSLLAWEAEASGATDAAASELRLLQLASDGSIDESRPARLDEAGAASPALAMSSGGDALLGWLETEAGLTRAWAAYRAAGASAWSEAVPLSGEGLARAPAVALDPSGNGHALWVELDAAGEARVLAARVSADGAEIGAPSVLSGEASPPAAPPTPGRADARVAVDSSGRAHAVWGGADGGIWSARFE